MALIRCGGGTGAEYTLLASPHQVVESSSSFALSGTVSDYDYFLVYTRDDATSGQHQDKTVVCVAKDSPFEIGYSIKSVAGGRAAGLTIDSSTNVIRCTGKANAGYLPILDFVYGVKDTSSDIASYLENFVS